MVYTDKSSETLLSYCQLLEDFDAQWYGDGYNCKFMHKKNDKIVFYGHNVSPGDRLLRSDMTDIWSVLTDQRSITVKKLDPVSMSKHEYNSTLEYIKFHSYHHIGDATAVRGIDRSNLTGYP